MKYQSLVSSTTPSDLQEWLGQELEDRGIDSVYARSVLSLLQQDCVDIEPWECQHFKNRQLKYGGPENFYSATKSKHQKWKTWGKQMLLTSNSCCKTVISDLERLKKKAAVDCLRSASDYVNDIEELIDEVCVKLKNFKNLKGEKDEIHSRNIKDQKILDPFFIPPSSPTDEIKKYFAAFPPLNDKLEKATDMYQHNIKNAWCGVCVLKRNPKSLTSNKCNQPIIPYSPLKQIKSIYQNVESTILLDPNSETFCLANSKANEKNCIVEASGNWQINRAQQIELTKQVLNSLKGSWKAMYSFITKTITLPLEHLYFIHINKYFIFGKKFNSDYLKIAIEELYFCIKTLSESNFLILNFDKSSNQGGTKNVYSNLVSFQKVVSDNFFDCADFIDSVMPVSTNKTLSSNSNIDQSCSRDFDVLSLPSIRGVKVSLVENSSILFEQPSLEHLSFEGNKLDINFIDYSRSEGSGSKFLSFLGRNCPIENICADTMSEKTKCNEFSILSNRENIWSFNPTITQFCGSFETENKCNRNLLPSNTLIANKEMFYSVDIVRDSHSVESLDLFMPAKSSFWPIQQDYSITNCLKENLSIREKDLHLKVDNIAKNQLCLNSIVNSERNIGQQLLKKVLFINKIYIAHSPHKASQPSTAFQKIASLIPSYDKEIPNMCFKSEVKELKSQPFVNSNKCTTYVQHCKDTVQTSSAADWPQKNTKTFDEMWLLYWGDNHNFIAHTWQKDITNSGNIPNVELSHDSEAIVALSKEIREDGDELLKGLGSIPGISDDPIMYGREMPVSDQNNFDSDTNFNSQTSSNIEYDAEISFLQQIADSPNFNDLNSNICSPVIDTSFAINNMESDSPQMLHGCVSHDQLLNFDNSLKATDYTDLSAFPHSYENVNPIDSDYYAEGGGWSFTSDSFLDYSYVNPYERSCSLDDLDLENTEYSEFLYQKRIRCTSETDEDIKQLIRKQNQSQLQKRLKQKITTQKRPCLFFLQGSCCRSDCKYSHDLSTTTCRFWKEGSCFKGTTCPFLHGYIKESDNDLCKLDELLNNDKDYSYSLESEADFPSLSSAKPEPSKSKSTPIKIVHAKGKYKF